MSVEIRPVTPDELGEMGTLGGYAYGGAFGDGPQSSVGKYNKPRVDAVRLCGLAS